MCGDPPCVHIIALFQQVQGVVLTYVMTGIFVWIHTQHWGYAPQGVPRASR